MKFTIPASFKLFNNRGTGLPYFYNDEWVSNGIFCIHNDLLKNPEKYRQLTKTDQPDITRVIPDAISQKNYETYTSTPWIYKGMGEDAKRKFKNGNGDVLWVDERYVEKFEIFTVEGDTTNNPLLAHGGLLVIMPMRGPED